MSEYRPKRKNFVPIGEVVQKVLSQYRPVDDQALTRVWEIWDAVVGQAIAANAKPAAFNGSTLLVHVVSSTWLHHIRFLENEMIDNINNALGEKKVARIKLKVGRV